MSAMTKQRTEYEQVVRRGWFAWVYWGVIVVGLCLVAAIWVWVPELLVVSGYVVIIVIVGLLAGRYALAARRKRRGT